MSLEIAIAENTKAIRELIAALANGTPVVQAQIDAVVTEAEKPAAKAKPEKVKADPKLEVVAEAEEPAATPEPKEEAVAVEVTAADVTAAVIALGKAGKRPELIELLAKYGVNKGSELTADQLAPFHSEATALLEG